jgi:hypothetical protein
MPGTRFQRALLVLAALPLLAAVAVVANNLDDPGVEALPDRPTTLPPRPAPPGPEDSRPLDPADVQAALLTAEEIKELLQREADRPPTPAPPLDPDATRYTHDGFGGVTQAGETTHDPELPQLPTIDPGPDRSRMRSTDGRLAFSYPTPWNLSSKDSAEGVETWVLHNQRPGSSLGSSNRDRYVRVEISKWSADAVGQLYQQSVAEMVAILETSGLPEIESFEVISSNGRKMLRHYSEEGEGPPTLEVIFFEAREMYLVRAWNPDRQSVMTFLDELLDSLEVLP